MHVNTEIHSLAFPEMAERGGGYSPISHPPKSATGEGLDGTS